MQPWQTKVVLVTGGSAGLGLNMARQFGRAGATVVIAGRKPDNLATATRELVSEGINAQGIPADVLDSEQITSLIGQTIERCGRLDVLVNNVGRSSRGRVLETAPEEFRALFELNCLAVVNCTRVAKPHLIASGGHVVNIGSLGSKSASRYLGGYAASKFALAAVTQQMRYELGDEGVHVLLVCPGPIAREDAGRRYDSQTSSLPEEARGPGAGVKLAGLDPDWLARRIVRACERREPELIAPAKARWLFGIQQLWPKLGDWILNRMTPK